MLIYVVVWRNGWRFTYTDEAQARKSMGAGDKIFTVLLENEI